MIPENKIFTGDYKGQTAVICGSAPCLLEDYEEIKKHIDDFLVIGVNEAVWALYCDKLITAHLEQIKMFKIRSMNPIIETHTSKPYYPDWHYEADYFWPDIERGATSSIDAVQICQGMGFKDIILAGAPMIGGDGYFHSKKGRINSDCCPRFGNEGNYHLVNRHQNRLKDIAKTVDFSNVYSMSGFTAEVFGKPNFKVKDGE
jgi:hypothetical protein